MTPMIRMDFPGPGDTATQQIEVEGVVDLDDDGEVVGVELLWLRDQTGCNPDLLPLTGVAIDRTVTLQYDPQADAAYIHLGEGPHRHQRVARVSLSFDGDGRLTSAVVNSLR